MIFLLQRTMKRNKQKKKDNKKTTSGMMIGKRKGVDNHQLNSFENDAHVILFIDVIDVSFDSAIST